MDLFRHVFKWFYFQGGTKSNLVFRILQRPGDKQNRIQYLQYKNRVSVCMQANSGMIMIVFVYIRKKIIFWTTINKTILKENLNILGKWRKGFKTERDSNKSVSDFQRSRSPGKVFITLVFMHSFQFTIISV